MRQTFRQYQALRSYGFIGGKPTAKKRVLSWGKPDTRSRVPKGAHLHSDAHLALVRRQPCIILHKTFARCTRGGLPFMASVVAHHVDELFPEQIGQQKKCSDFLAVPILAHLHDPQMKGSLHHHGGADWWKQWPVNPYAWLADFLTRHYPADHEGAAYAMALVRRRLDESAVRS
jgi:hypothetical protein